jgi:hypothetical protein
MLLAGGPVPLFDLVAVLAFGAVRVATRGLAEDADQDRDSDDRDDDQDDQGYDGYTHGLYPFRADEGRLVSPDGLMSTDNRRAAELDYPGEVLSHPTLSTHQDTRAKRPIM